MGSSEAQSSRPDYDQPLKRLLARAPQGFLDLIAPGLTWESELSSELPAAARRADIVWKVARDDGRVGILHVELQTKVETDIAMRVAEYGTRIWLREKLSVRSIVVFLRRAQTLPQPPLVVHWMDDEHEEESFRYSFRVVRLWDFPRERVLASANHALWPLASLMADTTIENTLEVAERIAATPLPRTERNEITSTLMLLATVNLPLDVLFDAVRRHPIMEDIIEESGFAQYFRQRGREEGREEGRAEIGREMARLALEGRFGSLSADVLAALGTADTATLQAIVAHVSADTIEQVRQRLGLG